jgi:hypothetical protein
VPIPHTTTRALPTRGPPTAAVHTRTAHARPGVAGAERVLNMLPGVSQPLGLRPATSSSDAAPLEGCTCVPSSAIERAPGTVALRLRQTAVGCEVYFTDGTLKSSWVSSDAFDSRIRCALGTSAPTACTFAVRSAAEGCRAVGPASALPPDRVACIVSKYSPRFPQTGQYV